jgi:transcriptional regulator with XRE-family HTH domain
MSENLGSLFIVARREKGLSLDEIAEKIHIKMEYLEAIETGMLHFDLPDIYRRGFYKSYADFLGLNLDEMMVKCPVGPFETLESSQKRREMVSQVARKTQAVDLDKVKTSFSDDANEAIASQEESKSIAANKVVAIKRAAIIGGSASLVALLLYVIVGMFSRSNSPASGVAKLENVSELFEKKITMRASEDVKVMVRSEEDKAKLFSGAVQKGSERVIAHKMPIQIFFDRGEFLTIELANGELIHPDSGRGGIQIK